MTKFEIFERKLKEAYEGRDHEFRYRNKIYWFNLATNEIYSMSMDEKINGNINGHRVGIIKEGRVIALD